MRTTARIAALAAGSALTLGGIASTATAATPAPNTGASPQTTACTFTVKGPAYYYPGPAFTRPIGGKHTGDKVTSSLPCRQFTSGFHQLNLSNGDQGWMYASLLSHPSPSLPLASAYTVTALVNVRDAPSTVNGHVIGGKHTGDVVRSPWPKGQGIVDGFAEVVLGNGDPAWISAAYLR